MYPYRSKIRLYVPDAGRASDKARPNASLVSGIRIVTRDAWAYLLNLLFFFSFVNLPVIPHTICVSKSKLYKWEIVNMMNAMPRRHSARSLLLP